MNDPKNSQGRETLPTPQFYLSSCDLVWISDFQSNSVTNIYCFKQLSLRHFFFLEELEISIGGLYIYELSQAFQVLDA